MYVKSIQLYKLVQPSANITVALCAYTNVNTSDDNVFKHGESVVTFSLSHLLSYLPTHLQLECADQKLCFSHSFHTRDIKSSVSRIHFDSIYINCTLYDISQKFLAWLQKITLFSSSGLNTGISYITRVNDIIS